MKNQIVVVGACPFMAACIAESFNKEYYSDIKYPIANRLNKLNAMKKQKQRPEKVHGYYRKFEKKRF